MGKNNLGFGVIVILILVGSAGIVLGFDGVGFDKDKLDRMIESVFSGNVVYSGEDSSDFETTGKEIIIEDEVYDMLEENENVMVIVKLRGDYFDDDLEIVKDKVWENQEMVLNLLNEGEIGEIGIIRNKPVIGYGGGYELGEGIDNDGNAVSVEDDEESKIVNDNNFELVYRYEVVNGFAGWISEEGLEILKESDLVEAVYSEKYLHTSLSESVPLINADDVWSTISASSGNVTGQGQTICVVDTGIDYNHPDLGGGFGNGNKVKGGIDFVNNDFDPMDDDGHGTHVAGIASANGNVVGVAPNADLIAVKVCQPGSLFSLGGCPGSAMIAGVDYCVANTFSMGTDVITMSIGDGGEYGPSSGVCPTWMDFSLDFANFMNIPVIVASGNENHKNGISYPACNSNAISVGAVYDENVGQQSYGVAANNCVDSSTQEDQVTCYSNSGSNLDVMAPGSIIDSTAMGGGSVANGGTSMAAPHVAGTIALIKQANPSITPLEIKGLLKNNGGIVTDNGNGLSFTRVDALAVINKILEVPWSPDYDLQTGYGDGVDSVIDSSGNLHIVRIENGIVNYRKLDNNGNLLINNFQVSAGSSQAIGEPVVKIDSLDDLHVVWLDSRSGVNPEVYYMKFDDFGNVIFNEILVRDGFNQKNKVDMDVDDFRNVHIVWDELIPPVTGNSRWRIPYTKIDNGGSLLFNAALIDNYYISWVVYKYSRYPSIIVDSNNDIHLTYESYMGGYSSQSGCSGFNYNQLFYKKLHNSGNILVNDKVLISKTLVLSFLYTNLNNLWDVELDTTDQEEFFLMRKIGINSWNLGSNCQGFSINRNNTLSKMNNTGGTIWTREYNHDTPEFDLSVSSQGDVYAVYQDTDSNLQDEIYYSKFSSNGDILINEQRITNAISPVINSMNPVLDVDGIGEAHVLWDKQGGMNYKRTLKNYNLEMPQPAVIGTTIPLNIYDGQNPGASYWIAISGSYSPGYILPNGHILPLTSDPVMFYALSNGIIQNQQGVLDSNGRATAYITVPYEPGIVGMTVYTAFVTHDNQGQILTVSPYFPITVSS
jgi:subtilisin family serine protease